MHVFAHGGRKTLTKRRASRASAKGVLTNGDGQGGSRPRAAQIQE